MLYFRNLERRLKLRRLEKHKAYVKSIPFSDFKAFDSILKHISQTILMVQSSNSSTIRYLQLFEFKFPLSLSFVIVVLVELMDQQVLPVGAASISEKPTVFITGDLSFFYDSNALWNNYIPSSFRIIIINNRGGGIFRILPGK